MLKNFSLIIIVLLISCNQSSKKDEPQTTLDSLLNKMGEPMPDTINIDSTEKLQNFWVLESVNDVPIDITEFTGGSPYFNFDLEKNIVSGYGGCNGLNGAVKTETNKIIFGKITATKTTCNNIKFEKEYLNSLSGHTVTYELAPGKLKLKTNEGLIYSYKKLRE